jgi:hypothetical protein
MDIAYANQLLLPHWLIIAGVALVLFGAIGILVRRPTDSQVAPETEDRPAPEAREGEE